MPNAEHSGTLGVATEEPRKGCPAAAGRVLLRLVKGLFTLGFGTGTQYRMPTPDTVYQLNPWRQEPEHRIGGLNQKWRRIAPRPEHQITRQNRYQTEGCFLARPNTFLPAWHHTNDHRSQGL